MSLDVSPDNAGVLEVVIEIPAVSYVMANYCIDSTAFTENSE